MEGRRPSAWEGFGLDLEPGGSCVGSREEQDLGDSWQCSSAGAVQLLDGSSSGGTAATRRKQPKGRAQVGETAAVFEGDLDLVLFVVVGLRWIEGRLAMGYWRWISVYQTLSL